MGNFTSLTVTETGLLPNGKKFVTGYCTGPASYDAGGSEFDCSAYFDKDSHPFVVATLSGVNNAIHDRGTAESGTIAVWNASAEQSGVLTWATMGFFAIGDSK